jgi:hypothetical protein
MSLKVPEHNFFEVCYSYTKLCFDVGATIKYLTYVLKCARRAFSVGGVL